MLPLALCVLVAFAIVVLLRRPGVFAPVLAGAEVAARWQGTPADDDDQLPETGPASSHWLGWTVAGVALVRVALLVALGA